MMEVGLNMDHLIEQKYLRVKNMQNEYIYNQYYIIKINTEFNFKLKEKSHNKK